MPSQAVIIGGSSFRDGPGGLPEYASFRASAKLYYEILNDAMPFKGNCTIIPPLDAPDDQSRVDADDVMDAIAEAVDRAKGAEDTLLVVYVGHGMAWHDLHNAEVHFATHRSREDRPWSWLPYSSIWREMSRKREGLRIVIADCCYSNFLHRQGADGADAVTDSMFALMERDQGTAIFTAVGLRADKPVALPISCTELKECTHFSGHFLEVLQGGSRYAGPLLSLGEMRDRVHESMKSCPKDHPGSDLLLLGPCESTPFVENKLPGHVARELPIRTTKDDWVRALSSGRGLSIDNLLETPELAARVSLELWTIPEGRSNAGRIDQKANLAYRRRPREYAVYWHVRDGLAA